MVALSTDKAVKPVNAMGISKAMMEKIVCSQNQFGGQTTFCCVRYGNVMGSRGSVIPLFRDQIRKDAPLTLTVPEMTRFLMTLDQSVDLVLHAMTQARGGEVFVRKAPACTVQALAEAMRLKFSPRGARHPIKVVGIRPGEKLHEEMCIRDRPGSAGCRSSCSAPPGRSRQDASEISSVGTHTACWTPS